MKCDGLAYKWVAQFSDGTEVSQFDESGENEVLFKEVRDKDINCFWLVNTQTNNREFAVNLRNGKFFMFGKWIMVADGDKLLSNLESLKYRLIYFRQVTREFAGMSGPEMSCTKVFFIGWQTNDPITGQNIKRLLQVHDSNTIAIG